MEHDPVAEALVNGARSYIDAALAPVLRRLAEAEARVALLSERGAGVTGFIRDRSGHLVLVLADGSSRDVGAIDGRDGADADMDRIKAWVEDAAKTAVAGMPVPAPDPAEVAIALVPLMQENLRGQIGLAIAALPPPENGKDVDLDWLLGTIDARVGAKVDEKIATLPPAQAGKDGVNGRDGVDGVDGKTVDETALAALVAVALDKALAARPVPKDGVDGRDGVDGKDIDPEVVTAAIAEAVRAHVTSLPIPRDGKDGVDGKDGQSITVDDLTPAIESAVARQITALPKPKDGIGLAGAVIGRDGQLIVTATDGTPFPLGLVVGRDGTNGQDGERGKDGRDGADGLGVEDLTVDYDGERTWTVRFVRGEIVRTFDIKMAALLDRGIWKNGETFEKGDVVSFGGSMFIAQSDTTDKPETSTAWRLAVKRGRDGKNAEAGKPNPTPIVKLPDDGKPKT